MERAINEFEEQTLKADKNLIKFNSQIESIEGLINKRSINVHQLMASVMEIKGQYFALQEKLSEVRMNQKAIENDLIQTALHLQERINQSKIV